MTARFLVFLLTCALLTAGASSAAAQSTSPSLTTHSQHISANPFLLMFGIFTLEYERKHRDATTWGASTSLFDFDHVDFKNVMGFYRYYPGGTAMRGFSITGRGGLHHFSDDDDSGVVYGAGFEIGYDWVLGEKENFSVGIGAGVTRLFGSDLGGSHTLPTVRLVNIGWRF